ACGPAGAHPGQRSFPTRRSSDLEDFQSDYLAVLPVHRDRAGDTRGSVELERLPPRFERHVTQTDIGGIGLTVHFDTHVLMVTDLPRPTRADYPAPWPSTSDLSAGNSVCPPRIGAVTTCARGVSTVRAVFRPTMNPADMSYLAVDRRHEVNVSMVCLLHLDHTPSTGDVR